MDAALHEERLDRGTRTRRLHSIALDDAPDGTFVVREGDAYLVLGDRLLRWTHDGYTASTPRPAGVRARLLTPPSIVTILRAGWSGAVPFLHPSARG